MSNVMSHEAPLFIENATLIVNDLETERAFYETALGLTRHEATPGRVVLGAPDQAFLTLIEDRLAAPDDRRRAGLFHLAYLLPDRAALGGWLRHADTLGLALTGAADHNVSEAVYLDDAEGFGVEVYADRPRAAWRRRDDGRIDMINARLDLDALKGEAAPWSGFPAGARIGHVHLRVGDLAATADFYTRALALARMADMSGATFLGAGGYHHHVSANVWSSAGAGKKPTRSTGLAGLDFAADAAAFEEIARAAGAASSAERIELEDPSGFAITVAQSS